VVFFEMSEKEKEKEKIKSNQIKSNQIKLKSKQINDASKSSTRNRLRLAPPTPVSPCFLPSESLPSADPDDEPDEEPESLGDGPGDADEAGDGDGAGASLPGMMWTSRSICGTQQCA
jgi:hypothetical protein